MNNIQLNDNNLYYIGGIVRDEILGLDCFDVDITYVGNAIEFAKTLPYKIIKTNEKFGTVKIDIEGREVDLASTRDEIYPRKGHLPVVSNIGCSLEQDVKRRDFTINTLAKSLITGEIIDYLGGIKDIENKTLRVLHDKSFIDDPTRIIRGLKFAIRFNFELDQHTKQLQTEYLNNINYDISYKRLKKELIETFNLNNQNAYNIFFKEKMYRLLSNKEMQKTNINIQELIEKYPVKSPWIVYLGNLDLSNIPLTKTEQKIIEDFNLIKNIHPKNDFEIYKLFEGVNKETVLLYASISIDIVHKYLDKLCKIRIKTTGDDIKALGIKPSPKYKEYLDLILKAKLENPQIDELQLLRNVTKN